MTAVLTEIADPAILAETPIGSDVVLEPHGFGRRFKTEFVGLEEGRFLIFRLPLARHVTENCYPDRTLSVRVMHPGGRLLSFNARVAERMLEPFPLLFVDYPERIAMVALRRHERARCLLPAVLYHGGEELPGVMVDLSAGGCRLVLDEEGTAPSEAEEVVCQLRLFGATHDLYLKARLAGRDVASGELRLAFVAPAPEIEEELAEFVRRVRQHAAD